MNKIKFFFKAHWLILILTTCLLTMLIIVMLQMRNVNQLKSQNSKLISGINNLIYLNEEFKNKLESCNSEKQDLQENLDYCNSEKDDIESNSNDQSANNWSLDYDNTRLKRKVRDLEDELYDCQKKLRNRN